MAILKKMIRDPFMAVTVKVPKSDLDELKKKAKAYTGGNLSEWIRYAGLNYTPSKSELADDAKKD